MQLVRQLDFLLDSVIYLNAISNWQNYVYTKEDHFKVKRLSQGVLVIIRAIIWFTRGFIAEGDYWYYVYTNLNVSLNSVKISIVIHTLFNDFSKVFLIISIKNYHYILDLKNMKAEMC